MKKPKAPRLVTVAVFTTITIIFWIFLSVYLILTKTPPINVDPEILEPIDPSLDQQVFNNLEAKTHFGEGETQTPLTASPAPEVTAPTPTEVEPSATTSATPTPQESPTPTP